VWWLCGGRRRHFSTFNVHEEKIQVQSYQFNLERNEKALVQQLLIICIPAALY
jgi:hypothetical protein